MTKAKGFTLIELAIVVAIIGLIAGTIFISGGTLFKSSKTAKTIAVINDLGEAIRQFKATYKAFPGDLSVTNDEIPGITEDCANGDNNEVISAAESKCVIEHLFRAGLIKSDGVDDDGLKIIRSPFSGPNDSITIISPGSDLWSRYVPVAVRIKGLPCDVIHEIDRMIDDDKLDDGLALTVDADGAVQSACSEGSVLVVAL